MDTSEIQKRVDALSSAMLAKAVPQPSAEFSIEANKEFRLMLSWHSPTRYREYEHIRGSVEDVFAAGEAYIAALPTPEQARMTAFMSSLSETIELGKKADVDVEEFVNPLVLLMQQLSKNALTGPTA